MRCRATSVAKKFENLNMLWAEKKIVCEIENCKSMFDPKATWRIFPLTGTESPSDLVVSQPPPIFYTFHLRIPNFQNTKLLIAGIAGFLVWQNVIYLRIQNWSQSLTVLRPRNSLYFLLYILFQTMSVCQPSNILCIAKVTTDPVCLICYIVSSLAIIHTF